MVINYDEKRDFQRMPVECDISYSLHEAIGEDKKKYYGKGADLSAAGVMFSSEKDLPLGTILDIHIHPYIKTVKDLVAKAEVVRNEKQNDGYIIGVKMFDVN